MLVMNIYIIHNVAALADIPDITVYFVFFGAAGIAG